MSAPDDNPPGVERRSGRDRRVARPSLRSQLFGIGSRARARRSADRLRPTPVDRYGGSALFALVVTILALSLTDAFLTLVLLGRGAVEINPVMAYYIGVGPQAFVIVKYLLTALPLMLFLLLKDCLAERYPFGRLLVPATAAIFGCVVLWQIHLLTQLPA